MAKPLLLRNGSVLDCHLNIFVWYSDDFIASNHVTIKNDLNIERKVWILNGPTIRILKDNLLDVHRLLDLRGSRIKSYFMSLLHGGYETGLYPLGTC